MHPRGDEDGERSPLPESRHRLRGPRRGRADREVGGNPDLRRVRHPLAEHAADYEWRGEGDEAEVVLYAPDDSAFERAMPAARLPGVESPVYAVASHVDLGWAAASATHVAPDLLSAPLRGLLLVAGPGPRTSACRH